MNQKLKNNLNHSASFRDPSGYVFIENGLIKRRINPIYFRQYRELKEKGIFKTLISSELLINHEELVSNEDEVIIKPDQIPFITYPYEWSFNQYKDAALLTLKIQKYCLDNDMTLKDASAFNVTFYNGKAIFIDTLSFDFYVENLPWRAYGQFISHFLGPLLIAYYHGAIGLKFMSAFIDGIPIKTLSSMLPLKTKLNPFIFTNVHLLAKYENSFQDNYKPKKEKVSLSKNKQIRIIKSLYDFISKLELEEKSEWGNYYNKINYSDYAFTQKGDIINRWVGLLQIKSLIDVGGNDGSFVKGIKVNLEKALICDIDYNAIDICYKNLKKSHEGYITPFVLDLLNTSASVGFNNKERDSFLCRIRAFKPDLTMALAVIHHITLSGNIPFLMSAEFFASFSNFLILEFPKREDSWVIQLLNAKREFKEYFNFYNIDLFEKSYKKYFDIIEKCEIQDSERVLYLLKNKNDKKY